MLKEEIEKIGAGDKEALLYVLHKLDPLIRHYAYKLHCEDAYTDLTCELIRILQKLNFQTICNTSEGAIVSYIVSCVKRCYLKKLSKRLKEKSEIPFSSFSPDQIEKKTAHFNPNYIIESPFESKILTEYEKEILELLYVYEYSVNEIAQKNKVSRQTVNQAKLKALKKLKREIERNENCE